jgi:hypothetical protein
MTESNNVRFVEDNGKWLWKRYNAEGSVIFRSPLFNTEREAREDYDINGGPTASTEEHTSADTSSETASATDENQLQQTAPENADDATAGTATREHDQQQSDNDNTAGAATI